jgi:hypothetical protein
VDEVPVVEVDPLLPFVAVEGVGVLEVVVEVD